MRWTWKGLGVAAVVAGAWAALPEARACAVCFGDPNSPMAHGARAGVWFLLAVVLGVQVGFGAFFFYLRRRLRIYRNGSLKPVYKIVKPS